MIFNQMITDEKVMSASRVGVFFLLNSASIDVKID